jgi:TatD DNase family protein
MIDSHCHIYADQFNEDLDLVMQRALEAGVNKLLLPNIDLQSLQALKEVVSNYDFTYPMMGLHPCSVQKDYDEVLKKIEREFDQLNCIAVGEIGIDLYWDQSTKSEKIEAFKMQCHWALDKDLPIVIHSRESIDLILDILEAEFLGIQGVFHCFTGVEDQVKRIMDLDMYIGIGGVVTFKNTHLREVIPSIRLDRLLIETDSPYLAPMPYRGKRNEPSYVTHILDQLATTLSIDRDQLDKQIEDNTLRLFKI